jgi:hypothetical protein
MSELQLHDDDFRVELPSSVRSKFGAMENVITEFQYDISNLVSDVYLVGD